ncbi:hypothetical protein SFRURICE_011695 [Spodoptera frugiperda]|nr:hypothetical protein SFRURICE_011695 [Spodoptera frugiperda]
MSIASTFNKFVLGSQVCYHRHVSYKEVRSCRLLKEAHNSTRHVSLSQDQNTISTGTPATDNLSSVNLYFNYGVFPPPPAAAPRPRLAPDTLIKRPAIYKLLAAVPAAAHGLLGRFERECQTLTDMEPSCALNRSPASSLLHASYSTFSPEARKQTISITCLPKQDLPRRQIAPSPVSRNAPHLAVMLQPLNLRRINRG